MSTLPLPPSAFWPSRLMQLDGQARWHMPQTTQFGAPVSALPISSMWPRKRGSMVGVSQGYCSVTTGLKNSRAVMPRPTTRLLPPLMMSLQ